MWVLLIMLYNNMTDQITAMIRSFLIDFVNSVSTIMAVHLQLSVTQSPIPAIVSHQLKQEKVGEGYALKNNQFMSWDFAAWQETSILSISYFHRNYTLTSTENRTLISFFADK